jgi:hypothetical protein
MARIPQEIIDRLKREASIAELAVGRGLVLERRGEDNLMTRVRGTTTRHRLFVSVPRRNSGTA